MLRALSIQGVAAGCDHDYRIGYWCLRPSRHSFGLSVLDRQFHYILCLFFFQLHYHHEDVERELVDEHATYVGYNDYDSDLR